MNFGELYSKREKLWQQNLGHRQLRMPAGIDFCSNDYLGFAQSTDLNKTLTHKRPMDWLGAMGSRLLRGQSQLIDDLEKDLARFSQQEASLFFATGYQANIALLSSLAKHETLVFSDARVHASMIDGIRLSGCEKLIWKHNDLNHLESLLKQHQQDQRFKLVVVESIYSMMGSFAPLKEIVELCRQYHASVIVDEAHATGLYGVGGAGRVSALGLSDQVLATIHTAGKALGVSGAWVAGSEQLKNLLVNTSRPFIYSTAPASYQVVACRAALEKLQQEYSSLIKKFSDRLESFQRFLIDQTESTKFRVLGWGSPVTSLLCGDNQSALQAMNALQEKGYDVRAIRPPSVPPGEALLRITLPLTRTEEEISAFQQALQDFLKGDQ